jgi:hypothetical protein
MKKIVVCGAIRNVEKTLFDDYQRISEALSDFDLQWVFVESDSHDQTIEVVKGMMANNPKIRTEFCGKLTATLPYRTQRLAHARNLYTQIVRENYQDVDYVVVADFDGLNSAISKEAVDSSFKNKDWDVVTSNQSDVYYDIWCLRSTGWIERDCWKEYFDLSKKGADNLTAFKLAIAPLLRTIPKDSDWIEVDSAHGGFLIFKPEAFIAGTHIPFDSDGRETCEIVAYNADLRKAGYRIFINPAMINAEVTDHGRYQLWMKSQIK